MTLSQHDKQSLDLLISFSKKRRESAKKLANWVKTNCSDPKALKLSREVLR